MECFGGAPGGPDGDLDQHTIQCIVDLVGFLPSGPDDLPEDEKRLVGRECFEQDPDDLDEESRQCIIGVLGYLPDSPEELNDEEMDLVMRTCFEDEHRGPSAGGGELDQETLQCIVATIGRLPSGPGDLSTNEKRAIGRECFGGGRDGRATSVAARGMSEQTRECIVSLIGRLPESPEDLTDAEKRLIGLECFESRTRTRGVSQTTVPAGDEDTGQPTTGDDEPDAQPQQPSATAGGGAGGQTGRRSNNRRRSAQPRNRTASGDDKPTA